MNHNCLFGWECPNCEYTEAFRVHALRSLEVMLTDDGTEDKGGDTDWDSDSQVTCCECGHVATVFDFTHDDEELRSRFRKLLATRSKLGAEITATVETLEITPKLAEDTLRAYNQSDDPMALAEEIASLARGFAIPKLGTYCWLLRLVEAQIAKLEAS